jgi:hypothetical protein
MRKVCLAIFSVVENLPHSCHTCNYVKDDNVEKVKEILLKNYVVGIKKIAEGLNISYETTQHILVDLLGMKHIATRIVPKDLNLLQLERHYRLHKRCLPT